MNPILSLLLLGLIYCSVEGTPSLPKVQVYSRNSGIYGKENTLICHVSGFHPPDISIQLLKNDEEIPMALQTDLAFEPGWQFHLTKSVSFTPKENEKYSCKVRHLKKTNDYAWEPDM